MSEEKQRPGESNFRKALPDNEHLKEFLAALASFEKSFCEVMFQGLDATLKLEVRVADRKLIHARTTPDVFRRPKGPEASPGKKSG